MLVDILTSLSLGLLASTSPCVFPLYPGFLAYISGTRDHSKSGKVKYLLGFFVLAGVLAMMLLLGGIIAALSISVGAALRWIIPIADILLLALGILLLFDHNPFKQLPQVQLPGFNNPVLNAFTYGLLYGPITLPCSGPLVVSIFAVSLTSGEVLARMSVFLWFGLGFGLPLLALSFLAGGTQRWLTRFFANHSRAVNFVGGILLVGVAVFDFISNWSLIIQ